MSRSFNHFINIMSDCGMGNEDDDDELDETKRKSRNLSEKKRRDQFNTLINELRTVVSSNNPKMDKSTVLKTAISNLKSHNDNVAQSNEFEINEGCKPSFLTNEEYSFLTLQSLGGFIVVFSSCGKIYGCSGLALLLGYLVEEMLDVNIFDLLPENDRAYLENLFFEATMNNIYSSHNENTLHFNCQLIKKSMKSGDKVYEHVKFCGFIKTQEMPTVLSSNQKKEQEFNNELMFVGIVQPLNPSLYNDALLHDQLKTEFVSHHNFEWKFLFLDERAPSIIGYSPFEVLGTSGYDYYHVDDLDHVVAHHRTLMIQDEGVSRYYRFLTKGHQWIWLQTKSYINRRQWNTRVEFVVCTHRVVNPLVSKNKPESGIQVLDRNRSSSSSSSTGTASSSKTSPPSWTSSTSESNYCDDEDRMFKTCEGYSPDDNSMSSSASSREMCLYKKRKTLKKFHRSQRSTEYTGNSSDSSNNYTYPLFANQFQTPSCTDPITDYQYTAIPQKESIVTNSMLEDSLQKKYTELQQIIVDRTEELRVVSKQLLIARSANQEKSYGDELNKLHIPIEEATGESHGVSRQFTDLYACNSDVPENSSIDGL